MMSSAAQLRKIKKPLIEKRRRERMNQSLSQLKNLVLEGRNTNSNESRYSKMEKVDILEMTVRYLQDQRQSITACAGFPHSLTAKYIEGYSECASQVSRYLSTAKELNDDMRQRLSQHLIGSLGWTTTAPPVRQTNPSAEEPQILSPAQSIDSRGNAFPSGVVTDCGASTTLKTSVVQNPTILSTKFAVLETTETAGSLSPSSMCSGVIIPLYLSSACSSSQSFLPIAHSPGGQLLTSSTFQPLSASPLFKPSMSTSSTPSPMLFPSSASPNTLKSSNASLMITGNSGDLHGNSVCCSSPRQGDECPSSTSSRFSSLDGGVRHPTQNYRSPPVCISERPSTSPSEPPPIPAFHIDRWRELTVPAEVVWRPWKDLAEKMS